MASNSTANDHTGQVTLTAAGSSYVLTRSEYDRAGRLVSQLADNAAGTDYEYDGAGRVVRVTDADGNVVENAYDPNGNVISARRTEHCTIALPEVADEVFASATFYDALNRPVLTAQQGPDGILNTDLSAEDNQTLFTLLGYDSRGNRTLTIDPKGNTAVSIYDGVGRVLETHQHMRADGDGSAGPESGTFEAGGGSTVRTQMVYDSNGRLSEIIDDTGATTRYEYDTLDRQTKMTFHDGLTRIAAFSDAGDLATYTDENGTIFTYAYDAIGRRTEVTITRATGVIGSTSQVLEYDGLGRLTKTTDLIDAAAAAVELYYDSLGRVVEESQIFAGNTRNVTHGSFISYPVTATVYPNNRQVNTGYDILYRRYSTIDASTGSGLSIADWDYFGPGRVAEVVLGNGLACTYMNNTRTHSAVQPDVSNPAWGSAATDRLGYDGAGRMIGKRYLPATLDENDAYLSTTPVVGFTTDFDKASNKLYERHLHAENRSHLYNSLDSMNRLRKYERGELASGGASVAVPITLAGTDSMYNWTLDSVGNWHKTSRTPVGGSETTEVRQHNKLHQITQAGDVDFTYDDSGNLTDDGTLTFAYDALNRVKTVTKKTGPALLATYTYDAMGRRIRKVITNGGLSGTITNGTTDYLYDGNQCVEERDASNTPVRQYVWGLYIDEILQLRVISGQNSVDYYPLQDLLYRTTALTNSSGNIVETYDTDAYGRTLIFNGKGADDTWFTDDDVTTKQPICEYVYTGRQYDPESELYYYRARYYNPTLGRFLSRDPIGYEGDGINLYEYTSSRVTATLDPKGTISLVMLGVRPEPRGPEVLGNPLASHSHYTKGSGKTATLSAGLLNDAQQQPEYLALQSDIKSQAEQRLLPECGQAARTQTWKNENRAHPNVFKFPILETTIGSFTVYAYISCDFSSTKCQPPVVMPTNAEHYTCACTTKAECTVWYTINDLYEFFDNNPANWYFGIMAEIQAQSPVPGNTKGPKNYFIHNEWSETFEVHKVIRCKH